MTKAKPSKGARRTDEELDKKIESTQRLSVLPTTNTRYSMKIFTMKKWLRDRYGPKKVIMEAKDFSRFLADGIENGNSAKAWKAAWNFWRQAGDMDVAVDPQEEARVKRQIQGLKYAGGKDTARQPDAIDSGRLRAMVTTLFAWGETMYALFFVLIFYGAFRKTAGSEVLVKDVRFDTDVGTVIHTARTKDTKASNIDNPGKLHNFKEVDNLTALLKSLVKNKGPNDPLFPSFSDTKANALIKKVASLHHWGEGNWVVTSLRHGTSREAQAVISDEPSITEMKAVTLGKKLSLRMGHANVNSKLTYQKSNQKKK